MIRILYVAGIANYSLSLVRENASRGVHAIRPRRAIQSSIIPGAMEHPKGTGCWGTYREDGRGEAGEDMGSRFDLIAESARERPTARSFDGIILPEKIQPPTPVRA
jgi:hypothetical protein